VSTGSAGFGVDAAQLRQVARLYDAEAADLAALADTLVPRAGSDQVGRVFEGFGQALAELAERAATISARLTEVAAAYEAADQEAAHSIGTVR
jgi:hypothetical protein